MTLVELFMMKVHQAIRFTSNQKKNVEINNEIGILKRKEKEEILRILKEASEVIKGKADELINSLWNFSQIEFIFSKMNFCARNGFNKQNIVNSQEINLKKSIQSFNR